ncbi:MAG: hypothetical protein HY690_12420 [Chloroflexi bacterium]|nr:hypothetical protein [Chloroflexota bacterium]
MARMHALARDEAAEATHSVYDANVATYGQVLNSTGIYAYRPTILQGVKALGEGIQRSGLIPARLRCLVNVYVASRVGCPY